MRLLFLGGSLLAASAAGIWAGYRSGREAGLAARAGSVARLETRLAEAESRGERLEKEVLFLRALAAPQAEPLFPRPPVARREAPPRPGDPASLKERTASLLARGREGLAELLSVLDVLDPAELPGAAEALLPVLGEGLERALRESSPDALTIAHMIARLGGDGAAELLWRAGDQEEETTRYHLVGMLAEIEGEAARSFMLEKLGSGQDRAVRHGLLAGLARRDDAGEDLRRILSDPELPAEDRMAIAGGILWRCQQDPRQQEVLWAEAQDAPPRARSALLSALARAGEPRAQDWVVEELRAGRVDALQTDAWASLHPDRVRAHRDLFERSSADVRLPVMVRAGAARTLSRIDREGAVRALVGDWGAQPESLRVQAVYALRSLGTREAQAELSRIAESDPSDAVRQAAR